MRHKAKMPHFVGNYTPRPTQYVPKRHSLSPFHTPCYGLPLLTDGKFHFQALHMPPERRNRIDP